MTSRAILNGWPLAVGQPLPGVVASGNTPTPTPTFSALPTITLAQVGQPLGYTLGTPPAGYSVSLIELIDANGTVLASGTP